MPCSDSHQGNSRLACNAITVHARAARVAVRVQESFHISICQMRYPLTMVGGRSEGVRCRGSETQPGTPISIYLLIRCRLQHSTAGPVQVKETHLQSVTRMDKQCRVLTSANKEQSRRPCLHTLAPAIDLQACMRRWLAAMRSLDCCSLLLWQKVTL